MTSLIGGKRVPKFHERIEAYGTIDELIAFIGLLRDSLDHKEQKELFLQIQDKLMTAASLLAAETKEFSKTLPVLRHEDIDFLEKEIDRINIDLTPIHSFIIPGGHPHISICNIARTVCRRAERKAVKISSGTDSEQMIIKYLNRLSDFLFVFSRLISSELRVSEITWKPDL